MENIGPVVLFVLYMAISAWAKQRKRMAAAQGSELSNTVPGKEQIQAPSQAMSFFDQIKKELFQEEIEPPQMEFYDEAIELEEEPYIAVETVVPQFTEGSLSPQERMRAPALVTNDIGNQSSKIRLDQILAPYSSVQQGIILSEILGNPKAMRQNKDWFHNR
ncbi:MAG: hypothetical protein K9N35_08885 [Candidatus Marinimicrobia bacterium]|nr:hypothetical protein [Candidatus Neomarinimicrobiota bacterium]